VVQEAWRSPVRGRPPHRLNLKLLNTRTSLIKWNREVVGNLERQADLLRTTISPLQADDLEVQSSLDTSNKLKWLGKEYHHLLAMQEVKWRQKSRVQWLAAGDSNTSYFGPP